MSALDGSKASALVELLENRWSCRAYLDKPVPADLLDQLLAMAQRSPSWCNTQPWQTIVVHGDRLEALRGNLIEYSQAHENRPDFAFPVRYEGVFGERRRECGWQLYDSVGIVRGDREASLRQAMDNFCFFGAPALAIITTEAELGTYGAVDCGVYLGNILLAAQALGLGAIAQAALAGHAPFFREQLDIPEHRLIVAGVSFGFPDVNHPVNSFRTTRAEIAAASTVIS